MTLHDCGAVNLIVGRNDTGKTSILEAIRLLMTGDPRHLIRYRPGASEHSSTNSEARFSLAFHNRQVDDSIVVKGHFNGIALQATAAVSWAAQTDDLDINLDEEADETVQSLLEPGRLLEVKVTAEGQSVSLRLRLAGSSSRAAGPEALYATSRTFSEGSFPEIPRPVWLGTGRLRPGSLAARYSQLYRSGGSESLLKVLRSIEPTIEEIVVLTESKEDSGASRSGAVIEVKVAGQGSMPLESMGEGFTSIISIITAAAASAQGLCLIDEVENGIHYSIMPLVWASAIETVQTYSSQIWATTHSLDCIAAAFEAFKTCPELLRVHRVERKEKGEIAAHTFSHKMLERALSSGLEVR